MTFPKIKLALGTLQEKIQKKFLSCISLTSALFSDSPISTRKKWFDFVQTSCFRILPIANLHYRVTEMFVI